MTRVRCIGLLGSQNRYPCVISNERQRGEIFYALHVTDKHVLQDFSSYLVLNDMLELSV